MLKFNYKKIQMHLNLTNKLNVSFKYIISTFLLIYTISCSKTDFSSQNIVVDRERFFNLPSNAPEVLKRVVLNMKMQDARKPFLEDFIKNQGYPNWEFTKIDIAKPSFNSIESNSDTLISVPIIQTGRQYIKSILAVKVNSDVWYKLLDGIKYNELPNLDATSPLFTAGDFLKLMMDMEFKVFGQNDFNLIDTSIALKPANSGGLSLPNNGVQLSFANGCTIFNYGYYTDHGFVTQSSETVCLYETGELVYTLNVPETGGGSGGGGSSTPPSDDECKRGFVGVIGFETNGLPIVPCPIITDTFPPSLYTLSSKCSRHMDSIYYWGITHNFKEQGFIVVQKNDSIYYKNPTIGSSSGDMVKINYHLDLGEILLAYGHSHAEDTSTNFRTSFSAEDLIEFNKNANFVGYTAILEVGNARYAFVLENVNLKTAFNISKRGNHVNLWYNVLDSLTNVYSNGQICTEQTWLQYLGSASSCGIGFYKSSRPNKDIFIKLN